MKVNKDRRAELEKKLHTLQNKKKGLEGEQKHSSNSTEATKEIQAEMNDVQSQLDNVKHEKESLAKEFRESFKNGKDHMSTKEFADRNEALNHKESTLKGKMTGLAQKRTHASRGKAGVESDLASVNSELSSVQSELQQLDIANVGTAQGLRNMSTLGTVAEATTNGGVQATGINMFNQGQMETANTNSLMSGLTQMGATPHTMGTFNGMMKSMQMNGQMQGQIASAKALIAHADPAMLQAAMQHMGITGTALENNPIAVAAALQSFDTSRSFNSDGSRTSFNVNAQTGEIGQSSRDMSSTYDAGSHNKVNLVDSGVMVGADISSGSGSIMARHAGAEVANTGIDLVKARVGLKGGTRQDKLLDNIGLGSGKGSPAQKGDF
jgi:hypothetical protein